MYRERAALEAVECAERADQFATTTEITKSLPLLHLHIEKKLVSVDGLLAGRPDFIDAAACEIVEYKTGGMPDGATDTERRLDALVYRDRPTAHPIP